MRSLLAIASAGIAAQTYAFDWDMTKQFLLTSTFGEDYESHPIYQFSGTNRATVHASMAKHADRHQPQLTKSQRIMAIEAHHNTMERRERLGLARVGMATPNVEQEFDELNSFSGFVLNVL